jgi:hypothetical protein
MRSKLITVSLPAPLCQYVADAARREDRSMASVVRRAVEQAKRNAQATEARA